MIRKALAFALLVSFVVVAPAQAGLGTGSFRKHRFGSGVFAREYWLYVPKRVSDPRVLVVYLHGCAQDARMAATGTRWNEVADRFGFVVAYPNQDAGKDTQDSAVRSVEGSANGTQCWNWFRPENQERDEGEPATIAGITRQVIRTQRIDPRFVFIIGASAGGAMANVMAATYPDLYAAVGSVIGCAYRTCTDITGASAHQAMGRRARTMPAFVVDGEADELNPFVQSEGVVQEWLGVADLVDNDALDGSVSRQPAETEHHGLDESALAGIGEPGDPCIRNGQWPCLGGVLGFKGSYPYSVFKYTDAKKRSLAEFWLIHGLGHDYPGGDPQGNFTDPLGPDVTTAAFRFFASHPRG